MAAATVLAPPAAPAPDLFPAAPPAARFARGRAWDVYLVAAALLVPVLQPSAPGAQAVALDAINALTMLVFGAVALARRPRLDLPLVMPVLVIAVGSFLAITNAESIRKSALTLVQDAYLYAWFVVLVALLKERGDQRGVRIAWMWAANAAAAVALVLLLGGGGTTIDRLFGPKGERAVGLFDGPNALGDYLMMSLFVVLSLSGQTPRLLVWGSFAFQLLTLFATKSNGSISSWVIGMGVWAFVRATTRTGSLLGTSAVGLFLAAVLLGGWWSLTEWRVGGDALERFQKQSFMGRFENSAEGREQIWGRLVERYQRTPLGIGPGNSSEQRLPLGQEERKKSHRSKEAHNDYLGYLVERGPLGLIGLLVMVALPFVALARGYRRIADRGWRTGRGGVIVAALAGGLVATAIHSLTMEKLHFRHFWMFLALAYAFSLAPASRLLQAAARRRRPRLRRDEAPAPAGLAAARRSLPTGTPAPESP